jgi:hypothetical protein
MSTVVAPWDQATVDALNAYQQDPERHPYTCPHRGEVPHMRAWGDLGTLIADTDGWVCESCGYRQNWAHKP